MIERNLQRPRRMTDSSLEAEKPYRYGLESKELVLTTKKSSETSSHLKAIQVEV